MTDRHIVLGQGGVIAEATLAALGDRGLDATAIGRKDADARDARAFGPYLKGASHVYLCVGPPYYGALWERKRTVDELNAWNNSMRRGGDKNGLFRHIRRRMLECPVHLTKQGRTTFRPRVMILNFMRGTPASAPALLHSRPSSPRSPIRPAAEPIPRPHAPETPCCIPQPADTWPRRQLQNLPSRNRSTSSSRLRGRRAAASSIVR